MLPREAVAYLKRYARGRTGYIVELGSGHGSERLAAAIAPVWLVSVEHDERFIGLVPTTTYIHAPIRDGWYDAEIVARCLPARADIIALVIDGPPGIIGRAGVFAHLDLFGDVPILLDDVHRPAERDLTHEIARRRDVIPCVHEHGDRAFATIGFEEGAL